MEIISEEIKLVETELSKLFGSNNLVLNELDKFLMGNSKRIRSKLGILFLKLNNSKLSDNILKVLVSGEILHNASLLHDDVIDMSDFRRGKETLASFFNPKISVLCGDFLVSIAVKNLMEIENREVLHNFISCTQKMCEAEIKQYLLSGNIPKSEEYIEICKGKTSSLFIAILKSIAELSSQNVESAEKIGEIFGLIFQIKNDLTKDSIINDKKNGIHTANDVFGIEKTKVLTDNYKCELLNLIYKYPQNIYRKRLEDLIEEI